MRRDQARLIIGSLGLGTAFSGFCIFVDQMYRSMVSGHFETIPVRVVLAQRVVQQNIPTTVSDHIQQFLVSMELEGLVGWLVDEIPLAALLIVVGGLVAWRCLLWEAPASVKS
jgi:hypothetical protein